MITLDETIICFDNAAQELPRRRRGRRIHLSTLYRWSDGGCRGVVLETIQVGGSRCTSREALQRFFEALSSRRAGSSGAGQAGPGAGRRVRSIARRQKASASAGRRLAELGA